MKNEGVKLGIFLVLVAGVLGGFYYWYVPVSPAKFEERVRRKLGPEWRDVEASDSKGLCVQARIVNPSLGVEYYLYAEPSSGGHKVYFGRTHGTDRDKIGDVIVVRGSVTTDTISSFHDTTGLRDWARKQALVLANAAAESQ